ncbi:MAG: hypothetical protein K5739_06825 [Lachnospiraceae bacterium]|nr:hypothetical protein [Lachnospiraceae bacterium]
MEKRQKGVQLHKFLILLFALVLCGCGKYPEYAGGQDYPFTVRETSGGRVVITLDGSKTPEDQWRVSKADEALSVAQKGKERKGKATYTLRPQKEHSAAQITFMRSDEDKEADSAMITMLFESVENAAGNGLDLHYVGCDVRDLEKGVTLGEDTAYAWKYAVSKDGSLILNLPNLPDLTMEVKNTDVTKGEDNPPEDEDSTWHSNADASEFAPGDTGSGIATSQEITEEGMRRIMDLPVSEEGFLTDRAMGDRWYEDPACHLQRDTFGVSRDEKTLLISLLGRSAGKCRISFESEESRIKMILDVVVDENGYPKVEKAETKGSGAKAGSKAEDADASEESEENKPDQKAEKETTEEYVENKVYIGTPGPEDANEDE